MRTVSTIQLFSKVFTFCCLLIGAITTSASASSFLADTLYVNAAKMTNGNGSDWANAFNNLQSALDSADTDPNISEIWVAKGKYVPTAKYEGTTEPFRTFRIRKDIKLYGGFDGSETMRSQRDPEAHPTILSGDIDGNDTNADTNHIAENVTHIQGRNAYHVLWLDSLSSATRIDGFRITAGKADSTVLGYNGGGGIYINGSGSGNSVEPVIVNCKLTGNFSSTFGGAVFNNGQSLGMCNPVFINTRFSGNQSNEGGAVYNYGVAGQSSPRFLNCIFDINRALARGGAVYNRGLTGLSSPEFKQTTFYGNEAISQGGAMHNDGVSGNSNPVIRNTIFENNTAGSGGNIFYNNNGLPSISYSLADVANKTGLESGCTNCVTEGAGMIYDQDPLFANAPGGNFQLLPCSPAVNAGDNAQLPTDTLDADLDGNTAETVDVDFANAPRLYMGSAVDMGALEFQGSPGSITRLYVDASAPAGGSGLSWNAPLQSLQSALLQAQTCTSVTEIWVAKGKYVPTATHGGTTVRHRTFYINRNLRLFGGFTNGDTSLLQRDAMANLTILSGDIDGNDTNTDGNGIAETHRHIVGANAYHVLWLDTLGADARIDGFVITAGQADGGSLPANAGGGAYINGSNGSGFPALVNCKVIGNKATYGGGVYNRGTSSTNNTRFFQVTFAGNQATYGGGVYNYGNSGICSPVFFASEFYADTATISGGAMYNYGASGVSSPTILHTSFTRNHAASNGAVLYNEGQSGNSAPQFRNSIAWGNTAGGSGKIFYNNSANPSVEHSLFDVADKTGLETNCTSCVTDNGGNLFNQDPLFVNAAQGDLRLQSCSPAINVGDSTLIPADLYDVDLDSSFAEKVDVDRLGKDLPYPNTQVDMGAFEFQGIAGGSILYVDADAPPGGNGQSWATAYRNLQDALDNSAACPNTSVDEIWVAEGLYIPTKKYYGATEQHKTFYINKDIQLYGGFAGNETLRSQRDIDMHPTILSGDLDSNDVNLDSNYILETDSQQVGQNAFHVVWIDSVTSKMRLDGFVITGGDGTQGGGYPNHSGGGIFIEGYGSGRKTSPVIANCLITGNQASFGGAVINSGDNDGESTPTFLNCTFEGNFGTYGGAIYNYGEDGKAEVELLNTVFHHNRTAFGGGAIYNYGNSGIARSYATNCTFVNNQSNNDGGAIFNVGLFGNGFSRVRNSILWGNRAGNGTDPNDKGPEIYNFIASAELSYTLVESPDSNALKAGDSTFTYILGDSIYYNLDPLFVDSAGANFRLLPCSPAINTGDSTLLPKDTFDIDMDLDSMELVDIDRDGLPRPLSGTQVDLGAYEYQGGGSDTVRLYVNSAVTTSGNGLSWNTALKTLQEALDRNTTCNNQVVEEIWVAKGVYYPTKKHGGATDRHKTFYLDRDLRIYGGFNSGDTSLTQRNHKQNLTILSGDIDGNDTNADTNNIAETTADIQGANAYHILWLDTLSANTRIDGFVVTAGKADGGSSPANQGGGIFNYGSGAGKSGSPSLANLTITGNYAASAGGGLFLDGQNGGQTKPVIVNSSFTGNYALLGGAMYSYGNGGTASPFVVNGEFRGNQAQFGGAGYSYAVSGVSNPVYINATFYQNSATDNGGVVFAYANSGVSTYTIKNSIVFNNTAGSSGPIAAHFGGSGIFSHSLVDVADSSALAINGAVTLGGGMLFNADPLFVDAANGDLRVYACSPAINAGDSTMLPVDTLDINMNGDSTERHPIDLAMAPRLFDTTQVDMGAYEFQGFATDTLRLYVDTDAAPGGNGLSWATAYRNLQDALDNTGVCPNQNTKDIWVAKGVYYPTQKHGGTDDRHKTFYFNNPVRVYGGFQGTEDSLHQRDVANNLTILSGDIDGNDTNTDGNGIAETTADIQGANAYHVVWMDTVGAGTLLDGLVITAGQATGGTITDQNGGGIYLRADSSGWSVKPNIYQTTISGNLAMNQGGGAYVDGSDGGEAKPNFIKTTFTGNKAGSGGAMYNNGAAGTSSPNLVNVEFRNNLATLLGGAIYNDANLSGLSSPYIYNALFYDNEGTLDAGAIYNYGANSGNSSPTIHNATFYGNRTDGNGGAIYNFGVSPGTSNPDIVNCIFDHNTVGGAGKILFNFQAMTQISYSLVDVPDSNGVQVGFPPHNVTFGPGMIYNLSPFFVDTMAGNFQLAACSPTVDSGSNTVILADQFDLDDDQNTAELTPVDLLGQERPYSAGTIDMGAYEFQGTTAGVTCCPTGKYFDPQTGACVDCPPGTYCPGNDQQIACPPGSFSDTASAVICTLCPGGTYNPVDSATVCSTCNNSPQGGAAGQVYCSDCVAHINNDTLAPMGGDSIVTGTYASQDSIITSLRLADSADVYMTADSVFVFLPGFHAPSGSKLVAKIASCTPVTPIQVIDDLRLSGISTPADEIMQDYQLVLMPNPTYGATRIRYFIPETAKVRLTVFDGRGQLVKVLLNDEPLQSGYYESEYQAGNLAAGVYFVILQTETKLLNKKLVLIRP